jgi:hypothetical protein
MGEVKSLIAVRKNNDALMNGGLRWIATEGDYIAYLRESKKQSVLVLVSRTAIDVTIDLSKFGYSISKTLYGQVATGSTFSIKSNQAMQAIWEVKN